MIGAILYLFRCLYFLLFCVLITNSGAAMSFPENGMILGTHASLSIFEYADILYVFVFLIKGLAMMELLL